MRREAGRADRAVMPSQAGVKKLATGVNAYSV